MFRCDLGDGADLRILQPFQANALVKLVAENRDYMGKWLPWARSMQTEEEAWQFIQRGMDRFAQFELPNVGIWQDDQMVGGLLFFPVEPVSRSTEVGYWLAESASGRGLMTRALRVMLGYIFDTLGLNRVQLQAEVDNAPSRAVAERLGFTLEGIRREIWVNGDRRVDMASYAILARDWHARNGATLTPTPLP